MGACVCISILAFFACVLAASMRADASVEFCPASTSAFHPLDGKGGSALYAFALGAEGPRHVTADVMVLTDAGWFDIAVPSTQLAARDERFRDPDVEFTRRTYTSAPIYVRFPSAVRVVDAFVLDATTRDDGPFGWAARGKVTCQAPAGFAVPAKVREPRGGFDGFRIVPLDPRTDLDAPPPTGATVLSPTISSAPGSTACAAPSAYATVRHVAWARFPAGYTVSAPVLVLSEIAVGADGQVDDASIYAPSGNSAFDASALEAAKDSTYTAGRSFCQPAPGKYIFRVEFRP